MGSSGNSCPLLSLKYFLNSATSSFHPLGGTPRSPLTPGRPFARCGRCWRARFGGHRKAARDGQADSGHLGKAGAFASEEVAPSAVAFRFPCTKKINPFRHDMPHKRFGIKSYMQTTRTGGRVHARRPRKNIV